MWRSVCNVYNICNLLRVSLVKTSYFANWRNVKNPLSIAGKPPDWYDGPEYKFLAPKYDFFMAYKQGDLDEEGYTKEFQEQVLNQLDARETYHYLTKTYGKEVTLLCYENPGEFCHRRLVANWFEKELKVEVLELRVKRKTK